MSIQTLTVLSQMLSDPAAEYYGRQLGNDAGLSSGTLYPILNRLEKAEWLASRWEDIDPSVAKRPRRRLYRLTPDGRASADTAVRRHLRSIRVRAPAGSRLGPKGSLA